MLRVCRQGFIDIPWLCEEDEEDEEDPIEVRLGEMATRLGLEPDALFIKRAAVRAEKKQAWRLCKIPGCPRNVSKWGLCTRHYNQARECYSTYGSGYDFGLKFVDQVYVPIIRGTVEAEQLVGSGA